MYGNPCDIVIFFYLQNIRKPFACYSEMLINFSQSSNIIEYSYCCLESFDCGSWGWWQGWVFFFFFALCEFFLISKRISQI